MGYVDMCGSKGYGFSAVLIINKVSLSDVLHSYFLISSTRPSRNVLHKFNMSRATTPAVMIINRVSNF